MQRRYVAVRGASLAGGLAGGAFQSWLGDILGSRPAAGRSVLGEQAVGDAFPLERRLQGSFGEGRRAFVWFFGGER